MEDEKELTAGQKQYENQKAFVVVLDCKVIGVWRNLKKLCDEMKVLDFQFFSYSSLSKRRHDENPIEFETARGKYAVYIERLK